MPSPSRHSLTPLSPALGCTAALVAVLLLGGAAMPRPEAAEQTRRRPQPETYHWVLPAHHSGVEVADLHPSDCYVIQEAEGMVYFGEPWEELRAMQAELGDPVSHLVDTREEHPECDQGVCRELAELRRALSTMVEERGNSRFVRSVRHRPIPIDGLSGGAYSDVGSDERPRYRRAPEQRMAYLHLGTARRGNCYEAKVPRTLSVHIRDQAQRTDRTGVYSGFLYIEHHHDGPGGRVVDARWRDRLLGAPDDLVAESRQRWNSWAPDHPGSMLTVEAN